MKKFPKRKVKLGRRIWFLNKLAAIDKQVYHIVSQSSAGRVQNPQFWPKLDGLIGDVIAAECQFP